MNTGSDRGVDVSVIVPTYDCRAHLDRCVTSLLVQQVATQIIVVDGGSRDGTAQLAELYAACHPRLITVIRLDHPSTPGGARNRGLAEAMGRYVYFCDADGHLGPGALPRMVAAADRNGSDIVLGRIAGAGPAPHDVFRENAERVALSAGAVYDELSCFKLFRREMLERHRIRFDETLRAGEDPAFCVHAYCHARVISVVADHDCYHAGGHRDGAAEAGLDPLAWLHAARVPIELMARHIPPGPLRDRLLLRHLRRDVLAQLGAPFLAVAEADREKIAVEVSDICAQWLTPGVRDLLGEAGRARLASLEDHDRLVRLARVETAVLRHHLTGVEWRGGHLVISGRAALLGPADNPGPPAGPAPEGEAGLVLRERTSRDELRPPVTRAGHLFTALVDVAALPPGVWDVHAAVDCAGVRRTARLGSERGPGVAAPAPRLQDGVLIVPFLTRSRGHLAIDAGGHAARVPGSVRLTRTGWAGRRLRVEGRVEVAGAPAAAAVRRLVWRERASGRERPEEVRATGPATFLTETGGFRPGTWDAYLELDLGGPPVRFPVKVGGPEELERPLRWWRGPVQWTVRPYATAVNRRLSTSVRVCTPLTVIRRMLRTLRHR
ncbi:glycosyltransferase family 2 protein [Microbispora sp. NPDC049125]|uniref:glycosyltransferase family 2 protein n=1 Tax=Microbispora sp. NPDC049125 TaxID=3154929 RepID=UPI00346737BB